MNAPMLESGGLREIIETAAQADDASLGDLTVMSAVTDPYRMDTPAKHTVASWVARAWNDSGAKPTLHCRGLHYVLVSIEPAPLKPDGEPYRNTDDDWTWLQQATGYARWLGYIPFDAIVDERNAHPIIETEDDYVPSMAVSRSAPSIGVSGFEDLLPNVTIHNFFVRQAYRLVLIGEKQSLAEVLRPIAVRYRAELVLPTGELSTTLLYGIVKRASEDGRPCRIFYLSDFDPTGYHMPVEVSRKVQALVNLQFHGLDIEVRRCALTHDQVRDLDLPSTPLKVTELRADRWRARWGVEQTEIDALATLMPAELERIVEEALDPYWDDALDERIQEVEDELADLAQQYVDDKVKAHAVEIARVRKAYDNAVEAARQAHALADPLLERIEREVRSGIDRIEMDLPSPEPEVDITGEMTEPLFRSSDDWTVATRKLIEAKL